MTPEKIPHGLPWGGSPPFLAPKAGNLSGSLRYVAFTKVLTKAPQDTSVDCGESYLNRFGELEGNMEGTPLTDSDLRGK